MFSKRGVDWVTWPLDSYFIKYILTFWKKISIFILSIFTILNVVIYLFIYMFYYFYLFIFISLFVCFYCILFYYFLFSFYLMFFLYFHFIQTFQCNRCQCSTTLTTTKISYLHRITWLSVDTQLYCLRPPSADLRSIKSADFVIVD